jgi:hypothetical protein
MNKLYNTTTKQIETLPDDQIDSAILQGTHSFAADQRVNVVDPSGATHSVPATQLEDALKQGFKVEGNKASAVREYVEENKGLKGAAKVALGKFADEAALGIPGLVYEKTGDPLEVAKWEALKKEHDSASALGSITGFGAGLVLGAPLFKGAAVAGQAAERVVAKQLAAAGVEKGSQSIAKDILARMATKGAAMGAEGAVISAPYALTEAALGDPEQAGETLLMGAGIGSALGLAGGILSKPFEKLSGAIKEGVGRTKEKLLGAADKVGVETGLAPQQMVQATGEDLGLAGAIDSLSVDGQTKGRIASELGHKRPDADDITAAFDAIGGQATDGALSKSKIVREAESSIVNDPTLVVGDKLRDTYAKNFDAISKAASSALTPTESLGQVEAQKAVADTGEQYLSENLKNTFRQASPEEFAKVRDGGIRGAWLTQYSHEELSKMRLFLTDEGVGYAIKPDGDLVNVFNNSKTKGAGTDALIHAVSQGATKLDCLSGFLEKYYNKAGFVVKQVDKWDDRFAPKGWDYATQGRPNVVYMEWPEHLSRKPEDVAKRFKLAGTELDSRTAGTRGPLADIPLHSEHNLLDWRAWRELDSGKQSALASGVGANSKNVVGATKFETGEQVKQSLIEKVKAQAAETGPLYEQYESFTSGIPVADQSKRQISRNLLNDPDVRIASRTPQAALAKNAARDLENVQTVADIKKLKSAYTSLPPTASTQEKHMASIIAEKLSNLEENTVRRFADREMKTPQAKEKVLSILDVRKQADSKYKAFMEKFGELGAGIGKKRVRGAQDFVNFLENTTSEKLVDKLFSKNNVGFMDFFSKEFPEEFQAIIDQKKRQIIEAATKDGQVMPAHIFKEVDKLPKEVQAMFFGEKHELFNAARKAFESMPTQINPSGTERFKAYRDLLTPGGALKNAVAYSKLNATKNPDALLYIEKTMKHAAEKLDLIPAAIDSMGKGAEKGSRASINVFSRLTDDSDKQAAFKKISKEISGAMANPTGMSDKVSKLSTPIQDGAPNIATQFSLKMTQALAYLDAQMPKPLTPQSPLIKTEYKPSDSEISAFERKLHTVLDPFSVIDDLKNGSVTRDQMEALKTVYPKIFGEIQRRIAHHIAESDKTVPYQARLKLSLIMGSELDPSLKPQAIKAYQMAYDLDAQAQANAQGQKAKASAKFNVAGRTHPSGQVNKST